MSLGDGFPDTKAEPSWGQRRVGSYPEHIGEAHASHPCRRTPVCDGIESQHMNTITTTEGTQIYYKDWVSGKPLTRVRTSPHGCRLEEEPCRRTLTNGTK